MKKYKAAAPEETVARIKDILARHAIPVTCTEKGDGDMFCSYRASITKTGYERIGTNGKGMTTPYAMASAYAEMMERFQNRVVVYPNPVWLSTPCMYFPDETVETLGKGEVEGLVSKFMPRAYPASGIAETSFECRFIPFYHVGSGEHSPELPQRLLQEYPRLERGRQALGRTFPGATYWERLALR